MEYNQHPLGNEKQCWISRLLDYRVFVFGHTNDVIKQAVVLSIYIYIYIYIYMYTDDYAIPYFAQGV